ncbi:MAG: hypothetical protein EZS28_020167 [Streblomastix strix]|uniref:Uncharacterized protein n=1 Tax=Streblomastix strix TaxID=222440 RepID=A0A5J4VPQ3_9EUKA|nr:MAG: hypothetical protein EZS28_020167 [Streblomastix strix]
MKRKNSPEPETVTQLVARLQFELEIQTQLRDKTLEILNLTCKEVPQTFKTVIRACALALQTENEIKMNVKFQMTKEEIRIGFANALRNYDDTLIPDAGEVECPSSQVYSPDIIIDQKENKEEFDSTMQYLQLARVQQDVQDIELQHIIAGEYQLVSKSSPKSYIGNYQLIPTRRFCYGPKIALYRIFIDLFPFAKTSIANFYNKTQNVTEPRNRTDLCSQCHTGELIEAYMRKKNLTFEQLDEDKQEFMLLLKEHKQ